MWFRVRARVASILDVPAKEDRVSRYFDICLIVLIVVNVIAVILESVDSLQARWSDGFQAIERVSLVIFSIEYVLRVWSIVDNRWRAEYQHALWGRLRMRWRCCHVPGSVQVMRVAGQWQSVVVVAGHSVCTGYGSLITSKRSG